jgi:hypothetical protein
MALLTVLVTGGGMLGGQGDMMMAFLFCAGYEGAATATDKIVIRMYGAPELDPL